MKNYQTLLLNMGTAFILVLCCSTLSMASRGPVSGAERLDSGTNMTKVVPENILDAFSQKFGNINPRDVSWLLDKEDNFWACFKMDGKRVRATFNRRGDLLCSVSTYSEELLPRDVLIQVKENYFKKNIIVVTEVNVYGKTAYVINLEDSTSEMTIKILDGQITEEGLYIKRLK